MSTLSRQIKQRAAELGFAACGLTAAAPSTGHPHLLRWLERGFHATMRWLSREDAVAKRTDVRRVLPGAKSVVCVALHYRTDALWNEAQHGKVARYARGVDYHDV